jgi:hypothetical protein
MLVWLKEDTLLLPWTAAKLADGVGALLHTALDVIHVAFTGLALHFLQCP